MYPNLRGGPSAARCSRRAAQTSWVVTVSSCATRRLRKAVVLVVLLSGVYRSPPRATLGGGAKSRILKTAGCSMTDHTSVESARNHAQNSPRGRRNHPAATTSPPHQRETGQVVPGGDGPSLSNPGPHPAQHRSSMPELQRTHACPHVRRCVPDLLL